jgi:hypothetical protein
MQAKGKAQKMSDTYCHTSLKLLAHYDQNTSSWKMSEATLALDLAQSLQTLPKSGMTQDGKLYERVMSVRLIKEQGYSLLPTRNIQLPNAVSLLPTPTAGDHKYRLQGKSQASQNLQALAILKLLPTPTAMHVRNHDEPIENYQSRVEDYNQGKTKGKPGASTGVAVRLIATPTTNISHTTGKCRNWGADLLHDVKCQCKIYRLHWSMQN